MRILSLKRGDDCQVHGAPSRAANRTLLLMVLAAMALIVWHVWTFGPTGSAAAPATLERPFPVLVGYELWDLAFDRHGILAELRDVFPYFLVGVLLAGYIRTYKLALKMQASLRRYGFLSVFLASLIGILTPLCACGTVTTAVSLLFAGLPLAPVMALMVTSPLMSPSTYLLTLNDLGPEWTVIRTVAAFSMGIFAGVVTHLLREKGFQSKTIFIEGAVPRGDLHDENYPNERLRCGCREQFSHRVAARTKSMFIIFLAKSWELVGLVGKYVLVGVAIGAVMERYMPHEWIYRLFGRKDALSVLWITLGSVPVFLHQISASSILYHIKSSLGGTLDAAAGLAFLIGGPVTAMPTMVMFWSIFKKRVFFLYLFVCIAGTLLIVTFFRLFVFIPYADMGNPLLRNVGSLSGGPSAVIQKQDKSVRMVMDPDDKGMIATYANDREGSGGVVFDASSVRFRGAAAGQNDDPAYVENIAAWLEQSNTSAASQGILIYDMSGATGHDTDAFSRDIQPILQKKGYNVRFTDRRESPALTERFMKEYSQLWVFFGAAGQSGNLTDAELSAIEKFTKDGHSLLIVPGKQGDGSGDLAEVNRLASKYGVNFSGFAEHPVELRASTASYFLNRSSAAIGRILKLVHKA